MTENNIIAILESNEIQNFIGHDIKTNKKYINNMFDSGHTLLSWAVKKSDLQNIKCLVTKGANVNQAEKGDATPLLLSVYFNRLDVVKFLVQNGALVNLGDSYETPLMMATRKKYCEIVRFLVTNRADINAANIDGLSPIFYAIKEGKLAVLEALVSAGIPTNIEDASGNSPLLAAVKNRASKDLIQCLLRNGARANESALLWAAKTGALLVIEILVQNGADSNMVGSDGNTVIATAVRYKRTSVVKYLTSLGVNVCKVGTNGKTPLLWAVLNQDLDMVGFLLDHGAQFIIDDVFLDAIATKNLEIVTFLHQKGAYRTKPRDFNTNSPLLKALKVESVEITKYFLENGYSLLNDLGQNCEVPFLLNFLEKKNYDMVKLLTENGARLNIFRTFSAYWDHTALTRSIQLEDFEMVMYFVENQADVNQRNYLNKTPLDVAASVKDFRTFQYLVSKGADIEHDPLKDDAEFKKYYQLAKDNITKSQIASELVSNQEAENKEEEVEKEGGEEPRQEKTLKEKNYYVIEFD